jgi:holliday junction DNA helicase RuvA
VPTGAATRRGSVTKVDTWSTNVWDPPAGSRALTAAATAIGSPFTAHRGPPVIASIRGEVLTRMPGEVVIEAAGVGYRMAVSSETFAGVPQVGSEGRLFTHLVTRDDGMHLFGFATQSERELFLMLIGVQSVGPKVALAVLSGGTPRELLNAIASGDTARFQAVPGIGKRTAERIIVELREKVAGKVSDEIVVRRTPTDDPRVLAREGLLGLGFSPQEADGLLDQADGTTPEELIAGALKGAR